MADDVIHPIACNYFIIADAEVNCKALFNLCLFYSSVNVDDLLFLFLSDYQSFRLNLDGGYLSYATLDGGTEIILNLTNNASISRVTMDDLIW